MGNNTIKTTSLLIVATIVSKILGFSREIVLASTYGTSAYSDAYIISLTIPTILFSCIGGALATSYIPLFCDIIENEGTDTALDFTNNIINMVTLISLGIAIVGMIFTKQVVSIFAMGFSGEKLQLAICFTRILFISVFMIGINDILKGYLQINNSFIMPALTGIPFNLIIITSIVLSAKWNIYILIYGTLLGIFSQFIIQLIFSYKKNYTYKIYLNFKDQNIKKMIYLVMPVFVGVSVNQINSLVDRTLASTLREGSISALNYANRLNLFVMSLFVMSIITVIYPLLSSLSAKDNKEEFKASIVTVINAVTLLIIPISIGAMALSTPIVELLFQRGSFDVSGTKMTSTALFYYAIGMMGFGLRDVLSRVFYSLQDTKTPMINGAMAMVLNIILNFILVGYMGHGGLALATSISALIGVGLLFYSLRKKIGLFGGKDIFIVTIKVLISASIMGGMVKVFYNYISNLLGSGFIFETISLGSSMLVGAVIYFVLIFIFKIKEVNLFIQIIKKTFSSTFSFKRKI